MGLPRSVPGGCSGAGRGPLGGHAGHRQPLRHRLQHGEAAARGALATLSDSEKNSLAGDLEACGRFDGLSTAQLTAALGAPAVQCVQGAHGSSEHIDVYYLPDDPSEAPGDADKLYLVLTANQSAVESASINRDAVPF